MSVKEFEKTIKKINDKIVKIAKELAKEKGLQCEISFRQENENYEQQITFVYECKVNKEKWRYSIEIDYIIYKSNEDYRIKILLDGTQICDRKLKNFKEIERKIREKLDKYLSEIVKKWKEDEELLVIANEIEQLFEAYLGIKPKVTYYIHFKGFTAKFNINENITIEIDGAVQNNTITVYSVKIVGDVTDNHLKQIVEIFKAMTAFL